ncbi:hypothetical protein Rhow_004292 [Rhodococcus wratislaviensis]|uniref:Uncharacterized protein n=1 Tax=Rhodococcus wratislaviensis TaxID=44752 RepID=A0A402CAM4_RHOWR|nr:hypothetical protein Rhow_004292 [Rhodococcus wratislaviensis]
MSFDPQLPLGLRGDEHLLFDVVPPTTGQGSGDDRHHLVLLTLQMRQQNLFESGESMRKSFSGSRMHTVFGCRSGDPLHLGADPRMVGVHRVEQCPGVRVQLTDQRPQPTVLTAVVQVQEMHHPHEMIREGDPLGLRGRRCCAQYLCRASDITAQCVVDDAHDASVDRLQSAGCHDLLQTMAPVCHTGRSRISSMRSISHDS